MTAIAPDFEESERVLAGISLALLGNLAFASSDAIIKLLSTHYSIFQLAFTQASFASIPLLVLLMKDGGPGRLRVKNPKLVVLRGLLAGFGGTCAVFAFSQLPLADSYAIAFSTPLIVTILSIPILGEKVGIHRWGAVVVGLVGVLVMVRPGFAAVGPGHGAMFLAAVNGAFVVLVMRKIARYEQRAVMVTAAVGGQLLVNLPGVVLTFQTPALADLGLAAVGGLLMGSGQFLIVRGLSLAPASAVAPMQYSMMLWAVIYGVLVFATPIDPILLAGAAIVIGSGLYIMHRERRRGRTLRAHVDSV